MAAQQEAIGKDQTAIVNVVRALADGHQRFVPENLALSLGDGGGLGASLNAIVPLLMGRLQQRETPPSSPPDAPPSLTNAPTGKGE